MHRHCLSDGMLAHAMHTIHCDSVCNSMCAGAAHCVSDPVSDDDVQMSHPDTPVSRRLLSVIHANRTTHKIRV